MRIVADLDDVESLAEGFRALNDWQPEQNLLVCRCGSVLSGFVDAPAGHRDLHSAIKDYMNWSRRYTDEESSAGTFAAPAARPDRMLWRGRSIQGGARRDKLLLLQGREDLTSIARLAEAAGLDLVAEAARMLAENHQTRTDTLEPEPDLPSEQFVAPHYGPQTIAVHNVLSRVSYLKHVRITFRAVPEESLVLPEADRVRAVDARFDAGLVAEYSDP